MAQQKHPPGSPMTLGDMRELGVQKLIASCLNDACRQTALIEVWSYPAATEIMYFKRRVVAPSAGLGETALTFVRIGESNRRCRQAEV
jgi:hypothetical protein